jgi:hypothetical protein
MWDVDVGSGFGEGMWRGDVGCGGDPRVVYFPGLGERLLPRVAAVAMQL